MQAAIKGQMRNLREPTAISRPLPADSASSEHRWAGQLRAKGIARTLMEWLEGLRVQVLPHPFWPDGNTGTVRPFPAFAAELCGGAEGCSRVFQGAHGPITMVWVVGQRRLA